MFIATHSQYGENFHKTEKQQRKISHRKYHDLSAFALFFYVPAVFWLEQGNDLEIAVIDGLNGVFK